MRRATTVSGLATLALAAVALTGCPRQFAVCGNGICDTSETAVSCPADCTGGSCGNMDCELGETNMSCAVDCAPGCGDGMCAATENILTCPTDCGAAMCGNGVCDPGETNASCPADCAASVCGNGACEAGEDNVNCPADCGGNAVCGNGVCEPGEDALNCAADCMVGAVCGNGICEAGEDSSNCPGDCPPGVVCGDGICQPSETAASCPGDCPPSPIGGPCSADADCIAVGGMTSFCITTWPNGYCSAGFCTFDMMGGDNCPAGASCQVFGDGMGGTQELCMASCTPTPTGISTCRPDVVGAEAYSCLPDLFDPLVGYCSAGCDSDAGCNICDTTTGTCFNDNDFPCSNDADCLGAPATLSCATTINVCYPDHADGPNDIGDPCTDDLDCPGNAVCAGATGGSATYPGGLCTSQYCDTFSSVPGFACDASGVCPSQNGFFGGALQLCLAPCSINTANPDAECDGARGDNFDYVCHEFTTPTVSLTELFDTQGAPGFCFQCEALFGAGTPECP